jgi:hypothetical protein
MRLSDGSFDELKGRNDVVGGLSDFFERLCEIAELSGCFGSRRPQPVRVVNPDIVRTRR